jgi:asparagine synthase (glutamine-hydrolysing)
MCGIAGIIGFDRSSIELDEIATSLVSALRKRGPDDSGAEFPTQSVALVHTRLAILDLSPSGHQPMATADRRYTIVFNGEIYNFRVLRAELEAQGIVFRTGTDTEVLLQMYVVFGEEFVHRLEGMFAFAIWDNQKRSLFLARDPLGIKPVYVWEVGSKLAFASELAPLLATQLGPVTVNVKATVDYLRFGSVQEPSTLVSNVTLLQAGEYLTWSNGKSTRKRYWRLQFGSETLNPAEAISRTRKALDESLNRHFVSDVPVGIFLSGGIDSTALVAMAKSLGHDKPKTFCISFDDPGFNEGSLAARTAQHFGADHTDWRMSAEEGQSMVHDYLDAMDQPSNDGFNTYCVSRLAHEKGMKVVLSGLGGDELFAGYPSFQKIPQLLNLHRLLGLVPGSSTAARFVSRYLGGLRSDRIADFLSSPGSVIDAWSAVRGFFTEKEAYILIRDWLGLELDANSCSAENDLDVDLQGTIADQVSACEISGYMRNQLLRDSDVMSMRWGLELRVPFVDRTLVDNVGKISASQRLKHGKKLLIDAVPEIPEWIRAQPKRGFAFPFQRWVQQEWSGTFEDIVDGCPIPTVTWYRTWCLFALKHFLMVNRIAS